MWGESGVCEAVGVLRRDEAVGGIGVGGSGRAKRDAHVRSFGRLRTGHGAPGAVAYAISVQSRYIRNSIKSSEWLVPPRGVVIRSAA